LVTTVSRPTTAAASTRLDAARRQERGVVAARRQAAIVGIYNTAQGRRLEGATSRSLALEAVDGALADAGLTLDDVDGISAGKQGAEMIYDLRLGPAWAGAGFGLGMIVESRAAVEYGLADVVVVAAQAGAYRDHAETAPWTKPENEFAIPSGMFTAAEFALIARRHMELYGTTRRQLSIVAATIRNNGSRNPAAVYAGRGPFEPEDIEASTPTLDEGYQMLTNVVGLRPAAFRVNMRVQVEFHRVGHLDVWLPYFTPSATY
jgi:acetyl-CoA acetyltransferase